MNYNLKCDQHCSYESVIQLYTDLWSKVLSTFSSFYDFDNLNWLTIFVKYCYDWLKSSLSTSLVNINFSCSKGRWDKDEIVLPSSRELLLMMLNHTAVCLAHRQWELRRIAQQVPKNSIIYIAIQEKFPKIVIDSFWSVPVQVVFFPGQD